MSQNPNDPNNQKKSNPLKDATSHFIKKKRDAGKWENGKMAGKAGRAAAKAAAKLLKAGVVKIVGAIVGSRRITCCLYYGSYYYGVCYFSIFCTIYR